MNFKAQNRNHRLSTFIVRKVKTTDNHFKDQTVANLGNYSDSTTISSKEGITLMKNIVKTVQKEDKAELFNERIPPEELVEIINNQVDLEDSQFINIAPLLVRKVLSEFGMESFFRNLQIRTRYGFDLYDYFCFIVSRNCIKPDSLLNYFQEQKEYCSGLSCLVKEPDIYEFLTFFYKYRHEIQNKFFAKSARVVGWNKSRPVFFDGTNFTFSVSKADPDHLDELDGKVKPGLRQFGQNKSRRFDRVCVGLTMMTTAEEIPLVFSVHPGNEQEISHFKEDIDSILHALFELDIPSKSVFIADAGNYSGDIIFRLAGPNTNPDKGEGYIIGRGVGQVDKPTREWALSPQGYYPISRRKTHHSKKERINSFCTMVKSRTIFVEAPYKTRNGKKKKTQVAQKQIALFSPKRRFRALETLKRQIRKALSAVNSPTKLKQIINKKYLKFTDIYGFIHDTGELIGSLKAILNTEDIKEESNKAGVFIITTSETGWPDGKILHYYREKYKVEHLFRTLKSVVKASPAFVYTYEHITSHFYLSVISVIVLDYIREKTFKFTHVLLSPEKIQKILQKLMAFKFSDSIIIIPPLDKETKLILKTFGIDLNKEVLTYKNLLRKFGIFG